MTLVYTRKKTRQYAFLKNKELVLHKWLVLSDKDFRRCEGWLTGGKRHDVHQLIISSEKLLSDESAIPCLMEIMIKNCDLIAKQLYNHNCNLVNYKVVYNQFCNL